MRATCLANTRGHTPARNGAHFTTGEQNRGVCMDELLAQDPAAIQRLNDAIESDADLGTEEFARLIGRSERTTYRAWKDGKLPCRNGKIPARHGIIAYISGGALGKLARVPAFVLDADRRARELSGLPPRGKASVCEETDGDAAEWKLRYLKAQTAARTAAAQATQMRNDVERGKLVYRAEVELDAAETAANVARALSQIPERAAGMCVGCTADEIASILRKEIRIAVDALLAGAFAKQGDGGTP